MTVFSAVGWPDVMVALIAGLPAIIGAIAALLVRQSIKTPSGAPIGAMTERTHDVASAGLAIATQARDKLAASVDAQSSSSSSSSPPAAGD